MEILVDLLEIGQTDRLLGQDPVSAVRCLSLARTNVRGLHMKKELVTTCQSVKQVSRKRLLYIYSDNSVSTFSVSFDLTYIWNTKTHFLPQATPSC